VAKNEPAASFLSIHEKYIFIRVADSISELCSLDFAL
jgi:hypothetical protein